LIERGDKRYSVVIDFQEHGLSRLPVALHVLRYEALVADFDVETRALRGFLDLAWRSNSVISPKKRGFAGLRRRARVRSSADFTTAVGNGATMRGIWNRPCRFSRRGLRGLDIRSATSALP
jgi:hypothetical protein